MLIEQSSTNSEIPAASMLDVLVVFAIDSTILQPLKSGALSHRASGRTRRWPNTAMRRCFSPQWSWLLTPWGVALLISASGGVLQNRGTKEWRLYYL